MTASSRRDFLRDSAVIGAASLLAPTTVAASAALTQGALTASALSPHPGPLHEVAQDEAYWKKVADQYRVTDAVTNLEAGYWGLMAQPVLAKYHEHIERMNRENSYFARREYPPLMRGVRERVAQFVGAKPSEIAFSRGATEALQALISQYNRVGAGTR